MVGRRAALGAENPATLSAQEDLKAALDAITAAEDALSGGQLLPETPPADETQPEGTAA